MAKGERAKKNWRLFLHWQIKFKDGAEVLETWPVQVPESADQFWLSIRYRERKIRKERGEGDIDYIACRNPRGGEWFKVVSDSRVGVSKLAYHNLVVDPTPCCPRCGKPLPPSTQSS